MSRAAWMRLVFLPVSVLLLVAAVDRTLRKHSPGGAEGEPSATMIAPVQPAIDAYAEFLSQIGEGEAGEHRYPDTFAGAWLDRGSGKLCIALTDCSERSKRLYDAFFTEPSVITYCEAAYSYNVLSEIEREILADCKGFTELGIDQRRNFVSVGVAEASRAAMEQALRAKFPADAPIEVHVSEGTTT